MRAAPRAAAAIWDRGMGVALCRGGGLVRMGGIATRGARRWRVALCFGALTAAVVVARPAAAGRNVWTAIGPDGGSVRALAVDLTNPRIAYAAAGRLFKTVDGEHWRRLPIDDYLTALAVDPRTPSTLYVGSQDDSGEGYIRRSDDGGETWSDPIPVLNDDVVAIAIDPQQPRTLYVTQGLAQIGISRDGGVTWAVATVARSLARSLALDPRRSGTVHAVSPRGLHTSTDYGSTWTLRAFPEPLDVSALAIDPVDSDLLYVGTYDAGLFRSADGGNTWTPDPDLAGVSVWGFTADAGTAAVFVRTDRGLFRIRGGGDGVEPTGLDGVQAVATAGATLYAGFSSAGIARSDDGGTTWQRASSGLGAAPVPITAGADGTLYAPADGVFRSTDHGRSWTLPTTGLRGFVFALAPHPVRGDTLYAGTEHGVFVSHDRAATWQPTGLVFDPPPYNASFHVRALAVDPSHPARLYAGTWEGLYVSADGGDTWQRIEQRLLRHVQVSQIAVAADGTAYVAVFGARSLFVSTDGGASWRLRDRRGGEFTALAVDPRRPGTLFAGRRFWYGSRRGGTDGLYVSRDGGRTWSLLRLGGYGPEWIDAVAVDSAGRVFAAGWRFAYRSDDASWQVFTAGLPGDVNTFAFAPDRPDVVYAGSSAGIFEVEIVEPCRGDCDGDGRTGVDDLVAAVVAAGDADAGACAVADRDANGEISIAEIIAAVRAGQRPCASIREPAYRAPRSLWLPALPFALFAADVDRDGRIDAVLATEGLVLVARGDGAGGFSLAPGGGFEPRGTIRAAEVLDLNGDGAPDLLLQTAADGSGDDLGVTAALNDGRGAFTPRATYRGRGRSSSPSFAAGDLDGDGVPDLVLADGSGTVIAYRGNGDGTFGATRTIRPQTCSGEDPYCYAVRAIADLNGDGVPDVVSSDDVLLGRGDGTFGDPVGGGADGPLVDLDGDGYLDTLAWSWPYGNVDVSFGAGDGSFSRFWTFASGGDWNDIAGGDLNGDGAPDFVVAIGPDWGDGTGDSADRLSLALNLGDGAFTMPRSLAVVGAPVVVATADVNGDGRLDLLAAVQCSQIGRPSCEGTAALTVWLAAP